MAKSPKKKPALPAPPTKTYAKVALGVDESLQRLWHRGLCIDDRPANMRALRAIGYFRLLIYMRRFQNPATKQFWPRTRFSDIVELYDFDRRLRSVTMDAIERIEVGLRAALSTRWRSTTAATGMLTRRASAACATMRGCSTRSRGSVRQRRASH